MKRGRKRELVLFVDVNFWEDEKVQSLTPHERDSWLRILAEQLRSGNGGELPWGSWGLSRERISRYLEAGLLVEVEGRLTINKWDDWNGREAYKRFLNRERVRRHREHREAEL